jgi:acyl-CoA synthetase (NDP forming)
MELAPLSSTTIEKLDSLLSRRWSRGNPVDLGGDRFNYDCIRPLVEDAGVDAVLVIGPPPTTRRFIEWFRVYAPWITNIDELRKLGEDQDLVELDKVKEMIVKLGKPIVFSSVGLNVTRQGEVYGKMEENYLVPYPTPERAAKALAHLAWYSEYLNCFENRSS